MGKNFLWRIEAQVPYRVSGAISELLEKSCMAVSYFEDQSRLGEWRVEGFTSVEPDRIFLEREILKICSSFGEVSFSGLRYELLQPRDWLKENIEHLQPTEAGGFFIHGSHFDGKIPSGRTPILLDSGTAFGSGEHASTAGCLMMIAHLSKAHRYLRPLDMGCGSGILSIAMAKTRPVRVVAADVDLEAVRVTALNAKRNGVAQRIVSICSRGYTSRRVQLGGPYDLIVANILTRPLIAMARDLGQNLRHRSKGGGRVILSGLLERDGRKVLAAHQPHGLVLRHWVVLDGWLTMVLQR